MEIQLIVLPKNDNYVNKNDAVYIYIYIYIYTDLNLFTNHCHKCAYIIAQQASVLQKHALSRHNF